MGAIWDMIKEIPHIAVLQEKVATAEAKYAALETENAILKDDNHALQAENQKLKKQVEGLTHVDDLGETEIKILARLAQSNFEHEQTLAHDLDLPSAQIKLYLGRLIEQGYIQSAKPMLSRPTQYYLSQKALGFLHEKSLI